MLSRLSWLQRCMPKQSQLQLLHRHRGIVPPFITTSNQTSKYHKRCATTITARTQQESTQDKASDIDGIGANETQEITQKLSQSLCLEDSPPGNDDPDPGRVLSVTYPGKRPLEPRQNYRKGQLLSKWKGPANSTALREQRTRKNRLYMRTLSCSQHRRLARSDQALQTFEGDGVSSRAGTSSLMNVPKINHTIDTMTVETQCRIPKRPDWRNCREITLNLNRRFGNHHGKDGIGDRLDRVSQVWTKASARFHRRYIGPNAASCTPREFVSYERYWVRNGSVSSMWQNSHWRHKLLPGRRRQLWIPILVHALKWSLLDAIPILEEGICNRNLDMPAYIAQDCLEHICLSLLQPFPERSSSASMAPKESHIKICHDLACAYLGHYSTRFGTANLSVITTSTLIHHLNLEQLLHFEGCLSRSSAYLGAGIRRKLSYRYTREHKIDKALQWLGSLPKDQLSTDKTLQLCTTILRTKFKTEDLYRTRCSILGVMLEMGVRPDRQLHNVVLLNAMEAGDRSTAWNSHRIILDNGVSSDAFTCAILLMGVQHGDGLDSILSIYNEAKKEGILHQSPGLAFSLIYSFNVLEGRKPKGTSTRPFGNMLKMYAELFDLEPLQDIGIAVGAKQRNPEGVNLMRPPVSVLGCMTIAWLRENYDSPDLHQVYSRYIDHIRFKSSRIAITAHYNYLFHAFIMAFSQRGGSLKTCASIVQGMQNPVEHIFGIPIFDGSNVDTLEVGSLSKKAFEAHPLVSVTPVSQSYFCRIPHPSVMTWSILLNAFVLAGKLDTAEGILKLMEQHGQRPNEYTWNHLITGYASIQNINGVVHASQRREDAGFEPDSHTLTALGKVSNRVALLNAFQKATKEGVAMREKAVIEQGANEYELDEQEELWETSGGVGASKTFIDHSPRAPQDLVATDLEMQLLRDEATV